MVVLCDGMIRSGSTWSFNVTLKLLQSCEPRQKAFGLYCEDPAVLAAAAKPRFSHLVIKSHRLDPSTIELCRSGKLKTIYTWRDPYDVIVSSLRMFGESVDHWIGALRSALRVWSFHRATGSACIIPYESIIQAPLASISGIVSYLGLIIEPELVPQIAEVTSLEQLKGFSQRIDDLDAPRVVRKNGYVYDRETLLHQNHIQHGGIGFGAGLLDLSELSSIDTMLREEGFEFLCRPDAERGVAAALTEINPSSSIKTVDSQNRS